MEACCEAWLTSDERRGADRFRRPTSRNQHVIGRGMARHLLGGDGVDARAIRFDVLSQGKPVVAAPQAARQSFNVAHTEGLVLCGLATDERLLIGVDVERIERRTDPALADRYFSEPEIRFLRCRSDATWRRETFLRIWTLKESFIKAIGTGLHTPLADFAFEDIQADRPRLRVLKPGLDQGKRWTFHCFRPRPGFVGAVAIGHDPLDAPATVELRSFDELVRRIANPKT
jgi:4'-phosphopantetheinyl transferase